MNRGVMLAVVLSILCVVSAVDAWAVQTTVGDIRNDPARYAKEKVTLEGAASMPMPITNAQPWEKKPYKLEYDLTDATGTIRVKATKETPPNLNKPITVKGIVTTIAGSEPFISEESGPWPPPPLIIALAVLFVLAVVLVILLVKKPATSSTSIHDFPTAGTSSGFVTPPQTSISSGPSISAAPGKVCPNCKQQYSAAESFCENCGVPLQPLATQVSRPTAIPTSEPKRSEKPTVQIPAVPETKPLADLTVVEGDGARYGTRISLGKARQKIGRREDMDIRLNDDTVSREHACIWCQDGTFYIQDEASTSGTTVNGQKITRQSLADNDVIQLGKTQLIFRLISGPQANA